MIGPRKKTIVITGGTGGIGYQSAVGIANTGCHVVVTGRNKQTGEAARQRIIEMSNNDNIELVVGDLSSIAGIDALASGILKRVEHIDVLVNNAGYLGSEFRKNDDGLEMHFAVNVLAPRRLSQALLPALRKGDNPRVLNITGGDKPASVDPDNLQAEKGFKGLMTYTHSKSVMESMSMVMAREFEAEGITVNVIFPGRASTAMTRSLSFASLPGPMKIMLPLFKLMFREDNGKSASKAARSTIWGATTPMLDGITGVYFDTKMMKQPLHPTVYEADIQYRIIRLINTHIG